MESPRVLNGPIFDGFSRRYPGCILYKGPFGAVYPFNISECSHFGFRHADLVTPLKGLDAHKVFVVLGVYEQLLWLHHAEEGVAVSLKYCTTANELQEKYDLQRAKYPVSVVFMNGPAGVKYPFDTTVLPEKYGVRSGERYCIMTEVENVKVIGEFLDALWVEYDEEPTIAKPLTGATNAEGISNLYGLADPLEPGSPKGTKLLPSPRRTPSNTPRNKGAPYRYDSAAHLVHCVGSFGNTFQLDASKSALAPWGLTHGERLTATVGPQAGSVCTVLGVHLGNLWIHFDGEKHALCCRNCEDEKQLRESFGFFEGDNPGSPANMRSVVPPIKLGNKMPHAHDQFVGSPRSARDGTGFMCWTAFGRFEFDTSYSACQSFEFHHGQTVKASIGLDKGKFFHIVGVRGGALWVMEDHKQRAQALRHCENKKEINELYGFVVVGKKDISFLTEIEMEPAKTPLNTPRLGESGPHVVPQAVKNLPQLNFAAMPGATATAQPIVATSQSVSQIPSKYPMPATRNYLKAVALLKTGATSADVDPLRFHRYFMTHTAQRLTHAMGALERFQGIFKQLSAVSIEKATTDDMLFVMRKRADIFQ